MGGGKNEFEIARRCADEIEVVIGGAKRFRRRGNELRFRSTSGA